MGYELLPHTADIRIRVWGQTIAELFGGALAGLAGVLAGNFAKKSAARSEELEVSADSSVNLLIDFLNEALYLSNVDKAVYDEIEFSELSATSLRGLLKGFAVGSFAEDVKAVTYHGAQIKKSTNGYYEVEILLDI